jgi:hypothetical protein
LFLGLWGLESLPMISIFLNHSNSYSIQSISNLVFNFILLPSIVCETGIIGVEGSVAIDELFTIQDEDEELLVVFDETGVAIILLITSKISHLVAF